MWTKREFKNWLELLQSDNEESIAVALGMAEGNAQVQWVLDLYLYLIRLHTYENMKNLKATAIADVNYGLSFPEPLVPAQEWVSLDLSNFMLENLVGDIRQFRQLKFLNLNANRLGHLPKEIGELACLERLYLDDNRLVILNPALAKLQRLENVHLAYNQLKDIPLEFCVLSSLKVLNLRFNDLTSIPPEMGQLERLEVLNLAQNDIKELPVEMQSLKSLKSLLLYGNSLNAIPEWLGALPRLEHLNLEHTGISEKQLPTTLLEKKEAGILELYI